MLCPMTIRHVSEKNILWREMSLLHKYVSLPEDIDETIRKTVNCRVVRLGYITNTAYQLFSYNAGA